MSVFYQMEGVSDNMNDESQKVKGLYPRTVKRKTIHTKEMVEDIAGGSASRSGELLSAIAQLTDYIEANLRKGNHICIDDLGTFSLTAECKLVKEKNEIRAESVKMKRVVYKMSNELRRKLKDTEFVRLPESGIKG